jgi:steroid delta-isomerase-like uncharacterized protein
MAEQDNVRLVQRMFDAWNAHDCEAFVRELDPATVWESESLPATLSGLDGARELYRMWHAALPDLFLGIQQMVGSGDHVVVRFRVTGTHKGDLMGVPPTGRPLAVQAAVVHEVRAGTHRHAWIYWDNATILRQLGVMGGA